ncbi:MAG: cytochrome ubiquinol oxidase subunit I [Chloroflexi bacterium]|nr:MAG: cytochrome ubiquinol oxidase subunit I [Chloroflexota bacterium]
MSALASAAQNLGAARAQMGLSLGWHIVFACLGVGFPALVLLAEWRGIRGDPASMALARRWAKVAGVLFAVGAVSGTILSFEMGILWPVLMGRFGAVFGVPFALEGFAFFIEAIFLGIYLYAWDRLAPRVHLLSGVPILVAGVASAFFVVTANAWMNDPQGFTIVNGQVTNPRPLIAMFNHATPVQTTHMILAAFMVTGFAVASVYAAAMLRGRRDRYHTVGLLLPLIVATAITPAQIVVGDIAAREVAENQPVKLAAMEGLGHAQAGAGEHVGGVYINGELRYAIVLPHVLAFLAKGDANATVAGLDQVPANDRPQAVTLIHLAFNLMVGIGFLLLGLGLWLAATWLRRRRAPASRWFLRAVVVAGPAAAVAMECGWIVTEVGRQPWIVYRVLRTADAVNPAPGLSWGLVALVIIYSILTVVTIRVIRGLAQHRSPQAL